MYMHKKGRTTTGCAGRGQGNNRGKGKTAGVKGLETHLDASRVPPKAMAWAEPSQGQAMIVGFGLAQLSRKPKPAQAKPKPVAFRPSRAGTSLDTFDFDSAYLNCKLDEEEVIYMEQPPGYETKDRDDWVWRLWKALYGLKQGARNWYQALRRALEELGFKRTDADHGVFYKRIPGGVIIVAVHVDDGMVTGSSKALIHKFKVEMDKKYKLTDLGTANWLLGIKISRDLANKTLSLSQHAYIDAIISRFNFDDMKPSSIPIDPAVPLSKSQSPSKLEDIAKMRNIPYREAVGSLMYAAMGTRPDIAFATSTVAQFSENPGWVHWEAVKRIFKYLLGTKKLELTYGGDQRGLVGYVDADGASQEHRRAISGYVFMVDGGAVSWSSKKQELVTLSTTEAEYVAQTHAAKEAMWSHRIIWPHRNTYHPVQRQQIRHCISSRWPLPRSHQAYRYSLSFHSLRH
jgi:hypothetical protein